jgi:hypothetical protein
LALPLLLRVVENTLGEAVLSPKTVELVASVHTPDTLP